MPAPAISTVFLSFLLNLFTTYVITTVPTTSIMIVNLTVTIINVFIIYRYFSGKNSYNRATVGLDKVYKCLPDRYLTLNDKKNKLYDVYYK